MLRANLLPLRAILYGSDKALLSQFSAVTRAGQQPVPRDQRACAEMPGTCIAEARDTARRAWNAPGHWLE